MTHRPSHAKLAVLSVAALLSACAAPGPASVVTSPASSGPASSVLAPVGSAPATAPDLLACALPSNCVSSRGDSSLSPLAYRGTPAQAQARLQATLAAFPEASVVRSDALTLIVI